MIVFWLGSEPTAHAYVYTYDTFEECNARAAEARDELTTPTIIYEVVECHEVVACDAERMG